MEKERFISNKNKNKKKAYNCINNKTLFDDPSIKNQEEEEEEEEEELNKVIKKSKFEAKEILEKEKQDFNDKIATKYTSYDFNPCYESEKIVIIECGNKRLPVPLNNLLTIPGSLLEIMARQIGVYTYPVDPKTGSYIFRIYAPQNAITTIVNYYLLGSIDFNIPPNGMQLCQWTDTLRYFKLGEKYIEQESEFLTQKIPEGDLITHTLSHKSDEMFCDAFNVFYKEYILKHPQIENFLHGHFKTLTYDFTNKLQSFYYQHKQNTFKIENLYLWIHRHMDYLIKDLARITGYDIYISKKQSINVGVDDTILKNYNFPSGKEELIPFVENNLTNLPKFTTFCLLVYSIKIEKRQNQLRKIIPFAEFKKVTKKEIVKEHGNFM